ncbi:hypothetical protein Asch01_02760 [Acinetobacter schindleri]
MVKGFLLKKSLYLYLVPIIAIVMAIWAFYSFNNPWGNNLKNIFNSLLLNHFTNKTNIYDENSALFLSKNISINEQDSFIVHMAYLGDFLSGTLGIFLSFLSILLVIISIHIQNRKHEINEIENRIFTLIGLLGEMKVSGKLSRKARKFLKKTSGINNLEEIKTQFKLRHADFSDFYRMLYQVLKFIKEHEKNIDDKIFDRKNVSPKVKTYTNPSYG